MHEIPFRRTIILLAANEVPEITKYNYSLIQLFEIVMQLNRYAWLTRHDAVYGQHMGASMNKVANKRKTHVTGTNILNYYQQLTFVWKWFRSTFALANDRITRPAETMENTRREWT